MARFCLKPNRRGPQKPKAGAAVPNEARALEAGSGQVKAVGGQSARSGELSARGFPASQSAGIVTHMNAMERLRQDIMAGPDLFAHKLDLAAETILLVRLSRDAFREASFLDDRVITPQTQGNWYKLSSIEATLAGCAAVLPLHFIFHAGHVGSTLLSRLIEQAGAVLALREPLPLRLLAEIQDDLGDMHALFDEASLNRLSLLLLVLWSRGYPDTRSVIVKATSATARIAPRLLALAPQTRAIYLHLAAEPYLATLLAGQNSPIDLRGMARERFQRLHRLAGIEAAQPLHSLGIGELAAMTWCAEILTRQRIRESAPERVLSLDFEALLANPTPALSAVFTHLQLQPPPGYLEEIREAPVWGRYAKATEAPYSTQVRAEILKESRERNREEIRKGLAWIESLALRAPAAGATLGGLLPT